MGMQKPLGFLYDEDTFLLDGENMADAESFKRSLTTYLGYLKLQNFKKCKVGIPFVVDGYHFNPDPMIELVWNGSDIKIDWFYYVNMSVKTDLQKWIWKFPNLKSSKNLYIKCSGSINWDEFLGSIWDFVKNDLNVILLDSNKILYHPKHEKILKSLALRGVSLGFHGDFPVKWWQNASRVIKKLAFLELVDFWQSKNIDVDDTAFQKEYRNKVKYQSNLQPPTVK